MDLTYDAVSNQGERVLLEDRDELVRSHVERYEFAVRFVSPHARVLDCACGTGYGSALLADHAKLVIGMDISPVAVAYCEAHHRKPNLSFREGSAEAIDVPSASVDLFVSIETIEHVSHPERLVAEAKRVLRPGGRFLVSTPNRIVTGLQRGERPQNPFHLFEWSLSELDQCLRQHFSTIRYFGQRVRSRNKLAAPYVVSKVKRLAGMLDFTEISVTPKLLERMETWEVAQPENFLALCET